MLFDTLKSVYDSSEIKSSVSYFNSIFPGSLKLLNGTSKYFPTENIHISKIECVTGILPEGNPIIIEIVKNGSVTLDTITLPITDYKYSKNVSINLLNSDYLTMNIKQVGTTVAGADLHIRFSFSSV